ncbi:MAG: thiol-disulfide oxidoreductase DCC family protein [Flavobacteriales bacterium]|nr:thiol-disulfide oxidoreductase DCC family protein [Flavobacteriales bacterium]
MNLNHPIVLFDGVCNFCNASVQFIIKHDSNAIFRFASLQSKLAMDIIREVGLEENKVNSVVLVYKNKVYIQSDAALNIVKMLSGIWPVFYLLIIIPKPVRDFFYNVIARNRYRWFGKKDQCMVPPPELKYRFLD